MMNLMIMVHEKRGFGKRWDARLGIGDWGLGIEDWGLGIGDWEMSSPSILNPDCQKWEICGKIRLWK